LVVTVIYKIEKSPRKLKDEILSVAERLFKIYGYDKTTFQMIADELSISKGAIAYHFKNKYWIIHSFFEEYVRMLNVYIGQNLTGESNLYLCHCIQSIVFFQTIMKPQNIWALNYGNEQIVALDNLMVSHWEGKFRDITNDFKKEFSDEEIHAAAVMGIGSLLSLTTEFALCSGKITIDQCCYHIVYVMGIFSRLDEATIGKNIRRAFDFVDSHAFPCINLFKEGQ